MKPPSPAEPVSQLRHVPIHDNGEPMVDFTKECPDLLLDRPRFNYRRETLVRASVATMLFKANEATPKGYRLAIVEGWRPPLIQRRMYASIHAWFKERNPDWNDRHLTRVVNQYTAPMDRRVPPPHTTGGAVDVFLVNDRGEPFDMHSPFEPTDSKAFNHFASGLDPEVQKHRQILREAMASSELTNYPSEYWHWSYGDQGWAYRGGHPAALYGSFEPPGWTPAPQDDAEEPLIFLLAQKGTVENDE